ncbi:MAG: hypothetical protein ACFFB3_01955 [Candidatus Hodarchaeota archaeon]
MLNTFCSEDQENAPLPGVGVCLRGTISPPEPWRRPGVFAGEPRDLGTVELPRWVVNPAISCANAVICLPDHPAIGGTASQLSSLPA